MEIARYWAALGFKVDQKEVKKVDSTLKQLEKRLKNFGKLSDKNLNITVSINKFTVDNKKLNTILGNALDQASSKVTFEISKFSVNRAALQATMQRAMRGSVSVNSSTKSNYPVRDSARTQVTDNLSTGRVGARSSSARISSANYLHAGGATGAFMRYGAASLPLIGGVYGASALNTANQDLVNANISAESVLGGRSKELLDRLSERSNYMGINYADTLPQFTKFMASSMPLMGVDSSQQTFESFMQFGRTRGASKVSMNRALTAVGQMSAKGQVMAEELKGQLGDAAGFGEVPQLFAEAYQIQTGGNLTGAKARAALMKAMQDGNVKTADILPLVSKLMDELSRGGIEKARMSSSAQQARAENAISGRGGLLQTFSESGGETGFARLWSSFAVAMKEAKPAVESLSRAFNEISKYTSFAMLLPQSFKRAFEGRDSWVADALGEQNTATAKALYEGMKELGGEITKTLGIAVDGWKMIFAEFGDEMLSFVNGLKNFFLYTVKAINAMVTGDFTGATNASNALRGTLAGKSQEEISALAAGGGKPVSLFDMATGAGQTWAQYTPPVLMAEAVKDAYGWAGEKTGITPWAQNFSSLMDKGLNRDRGTGGQNTVAVTMDVKISAANPEDFNEKFQEKFKGVIESTLLQYGQKE